MSTLGRELGVEVSAATSADYRALLPRGEGPAPVQLGGPPLVGRVAERPGLTPHPGGGPVENDVMGSTRGKLIP